MTSLKNAKFTSVPARLCKAFSDEVEQEWVTNSACSREYFSQVLRPEGLLTFHRASDLEAILGYPVKPTQEYYWAIKGIDPRTNEQTSISQVKLNLPNRKYSSPKGSGSDAVFLPLFGYSWEAAIKEFGLVICEGVKKAAALISLGIPAVSAIGVQSFSPEGSKGKREFLSWAVNIAKEVGKPIYLMPDGDIDSNEDVLWGVAKAYQWYKDDEVDCKVIHLRSQHKGIDDHLAAITEGERHAELLKVMAQEYDVEKLKQQLEKQFKKPEEDNRPDDAVYIAECFSEKTREELRYDLSQQVFKFWEGRYWKNRPIEIIEKEVKAYALAEGFTMKSSRKYKDVVEVSRLNLLQEEWKSADRKLWINFSNGLYNTATRKFHEGEHKPELLLTSCLERDYSPIETSNKTILELLQEHCPTFYRWARQALVRDEPILKVLAVINGVITFRFSELQMFLHTYGKPGTGKGTFNRLLEKVVGADNYTSTRLNKLTQDYEISEFISKQLVICPDEDRVFGNYSGLKSLTGGDTISYRPIYGKPARAKFDGTIVVTANDAVFGGDTTGLDRRMCVLSFNNPIRDRDPLIENALEDELSSLTSVALAMAPQEVASYIKGQNEGEAGKAEKWALKVRADAIAHWMDEKLLYQASAFTPITKGGEEDDSQSVSLYSNYQEFCRANGYQPGNSATFGKRLKEYTEFLGWETSISRRTPSWGGAARVNCMVGLTLRSETEQNYPTISDLLSAEPADELGDVSGQITPMSGASSASVPATGSTSRTV